MKFKSKMNIKVILQKTGAKLPKGTKKKKTKKQNNPKYTRRRHVSPF